MTVMTPHLLHLSVSHRMPFATTSSLTEEWVNVKVFVTTDTNFPMSSTGKHKSYHHSASSHAAVISTFPARAVFIFFLFLFLFLAVLLYSGFIHTYFSNGEEIMVPPVSVSALISITNTSSISRTSPPPEELKRSIPIPPISCVNATCRQPPSPTTTVSTDPSPLCPDYFRWIHEDLRPWKETGITEEMVHRARRTANFRLVVVDGRAYIERYKTAFQTRDVFTLWGIVQLLRRYPGRLPDLDLMFDCVDWPVVLASHYRRRRPSGVNSTNVLAPPPLFRYCGDDRTLDIVFPDWSFWGWPEINIKPWDSLSKELKEGNKRIKWIDREPYAYWKGNPMVAPTRIDLMKCNVSQNQDWNARVFAQDWAAEIEQGFKQSDLGSQCNYRYKIYIEGSAWSVSEKYILACDSLALIVTPKYYDFFTRSLVPVKHYWPVNTSEKCRSIKFAVDWGNHHKRKAQEIGKEASDFVLENLKMEFVYDYMFHLLNEYSKLLKFKPRIPRESFEICPESIACDSSGLTRRFLMESMVNSSQPSGPCTLPPTFTPVELRSITRRKVNSVRRVEIWEREAQGV